MKQLSMSPTQRENLLEMCKDLFDEFHNIRYGKGWEYNNLWMDSIPSSVPDPVEIHWFELCMTELPLRIGKRKVNGGLGRGTAMVTLISLLSQQKHPIDTLYEQYKKLKNEHT
jgi:hypothetical protein